jgi:hypothetical protein
MIVGNSFIKNVAQPVTNRKTEIVIILRMMRDGVDDNHSLGSGFCRNDMMLYLLSQNYLLAFWM